MPRHDEFGCLRGLRAVGGGDGCLHDVDARYEVGVRAVSVPGEGVGGG